MNSQLYTAASGLIVESRRMDLVSNNLANVSTSGFRSQRVFSTIYEGVAAVDPALRAGNQSVALAGSYDVPLPGPMQPTGRPLDIALAPDEWLTVQSADGPRYTRAGSLQIDETGRLVDGSGRTLLNSERKPIEGLGDRVEISGDGAVHSDGGEVARLLVMRDDNRRLRPTGDGLYGADGALKKVDDPKVRNGWLEGSNTIALDEMIKLIESQRAFESYQRLVNVTMNEVNRRTVNEIAG